MRTLRLLLLPFLIPCCWAVPAATGLGQSTARLTDHVDSRPTSPAPQPSSTNVSGEAARLERSTRRQWQAVPAPSQPTRVDATAPATPASEDDRTAAAPGVTSHLSDLLPLAPGTRPDPPIGQTADPATANYYRLNDTRPTQVNENRPQAAPETSSRRLAPRYQIGDQAAQEEPGSVSDVAIETGNPPASTTGTQAAGNETTTGVLETIDSPLIASLVAQNFSDEEPLTEQTSFEPSSVLTPLIQTSPGTESQAETQLPTTTPPVERIASVPENLRRTPVSEPNPSISAVRLGRMNFSDPGEYLRQPLRFTFVDPEEFLRPRRSPSLFDQLPPLQSRVAVRPGHSFGAETGSRPDPKVVSVPRVFSVPQQDETLAVSDVDDPIAAIPFARLAQNDSLGLLKNEQREAVPVIVAGTYAEFTGQPWVDHYATYQAHNFRHRPLYFEEVNLERYGNRLPLQPVVSAAHFFTSAALLPYKLGAESPRCCYSTLGHQRPGDCVPFRHHRTPFSFKGLIYQGLAITAVAL